MTEDKMDIEKAREVIRKFMALPSLNVTLSHIADYNEANGFINGWESRQTEIDELKKEIECLRDKSGVGSDEFIRATKKLGWPKEKTDDR